MALQNNVNYCKMQGWSAITQWAASTVTAAGTLRRQTSPAVGGERVFVCIIAGTTAAAEPTWVLTRGATTTESAGVRWQECTGWAGLNGDLTNTTNDTQIMNGSVTLGQMIKNSAGTHLFICSLAGSTGSLLPTWNTTTGGVTSYTTTNWVCIGPIANFSTKWGAPFARLQTPITNGFMGFSALPNTTQNLYISDAHVETQAAAMTFTNVTASTVALPHTIACVQDANYLVPSTGASVTCTVGNLTIGSIFAKYYGISFADTTASSGAIVIGGGASTGGSIEFELCTFSAPLSITMGIVWFSINSRRCTYTITGTGATGLIYTGGPVNHINDNFVIAGTVATGFFQPSNSGYVTVRDCDLSGINVAIVNASNFSGFGLADIINCKLPSAATLVSPLTTQKIWGGRVRFMNCDSAATDYRYYLAQYAGTIQSETTIVRTGGASNGTTALSCNVTVSAGANYTNPLLSDPLPAKWNAVTGVLQTATIYLASNTALDNSLCWVELEYLGDASTPLGLLASTKMAFMGTPVALTSDTSTWGGSLAHVYKIQVPFTALQAGYVQARVAYAAANANVYTDFLMDVA